MRLNKFNRKQLLKLLAVIMLSDGYIHGGKNKSPSLRLTTSITSTDQHQIFSVLCQKLFHKKPKTYFLKPYGLYLKQMRQSELFSVNAVKELKNSSKTFKTTPFRESKKVFLKSNQPTARFLLDESKELKWAALKLWFDFDGSISPIFKLKRKRDKKGKKIYKYYQVQFECEIIIAETNPQLVEDLLIFLKSLGINARKRKDNRNWSGLGGVTISELNSVKKFLKHGQPFTNTIVSNKSSRFSGKPKKVIMTAASKIIENYPSSRYFTSQKKAFKYRSQLNQILNKVVQNRSPVV